MPCVWDILVLDEGKESEKFYKPNTTFDCDVLHMILVCFMLTMFSEDYYLCPTVSISTIFFSFFFYFSTCCLTFS